jgi:prophage regulatory protein
MPQADLAKGARDQETRPTFLRLPAVLKETGLGRSTIYRMVAEQTFPAPFRLSKRVIGWRRVDIDAWTATRPSSH